MQKLFKLLKSRTFWTLVVLFVVNGVEGIRNAIPGDALPVIDGILTFLTIYFAKISPRIDINSN